jgi:predicted transcriptional regulator
VFGDLEAAIMDYLWAQGQGTVSAVYRELTQQREVAYTTVKTVMERLAEKGYLHCDTQQRAYVYTPTQSRADFLRQVSDAVLSGLLADFGQTIAVQLLEETVRQCDPEALDRLQALIEARRAADSNSGR